MAIAGTICRVRLFVLCWADGRHFEFLKLVVIEDIVHAREREWWILLILADATQKGECIYKENWR
jgi:hypothetical protein